LWEYVLDIGIDDLVEFLDVRQDRWVLEPEALLERRNFVILVGRAATGVLGMEAINDMCRPLSLLTISYRIPAL
jgi:hypothetical protein